MKNEKRLTHQQQPTSDTCVHACIAMVCGLHVKEVIEKYSPNRESILLDNIQGILKENEVMSIRYANCWLPWNRVFVVVVPSLNLTGRLHCIVLETNEGGMTIYDPNSGKEGVKSYGEDCDILSYGDIIEVFPFHTMPVNIKEVNANKTKR